MKTAFPVLVALCLSRVAVGAAPSLEFATFFGADFGESAADVALDAEGNIYMVGLSRDLVAAEGSLNDATGSSFDVFVMKVDPTGSRLLYAAVFGGSGPDRGTAIAVDSDGAAYISGVAFSSDFPVTPDAAQTVFGGGTRDGFIAKLSSDGSRLVYCTYLGGDSFDDVNSLEIDADGRAWIAGTTASTDFPSTADALLADQPSTLRSGFLARVALDGSEFEYSTLVGASGRDEVFALELDPRGAVWLAGYTTSSDFPVTPSALGAERRGADDAFVARLSTQGTVIEAASYLGGAVCVDPFGGVFCDFAKTLAIDGDRVIVGGRTLAPDFPLGLNLIQPVSGGGVAFGDGFVVELDRDLTQARRGTFLGGRSEDEINAVAVNDAGEIIVVGSTGSPDFPATADAVQSQYDRLDEGFLAVLDADLSSLRYSTFLGGHGGDRGFALALGGEAVVVAAGETASRNFPVTAGVVQEELRSLRAEGGDAYLAKFSIPPTPRIFSGGIVNAASLQPALLAPGQIISVFGRGLGPLAARTAALADDGRLATELAGVRLLIDGIAAPLAFLGNRQLNAIVPYGIVPGPLVEIVLERNGASSEPLGLPATAQAPAIFTADGSGSGQAAVFNQDFTLNGPANPAERGSIVVFFATGEGETSPLGVDGLIAGAVPPRPAREIVVGIGGEGAPLLYVGGAPGLTAGLMQVNARIPLNARTGPETDLLFFIGGVRSQRGVTLAVR